MMRQKRDPAASQTFVDLQVVMTMTYDRMLAALHHDVVEQPVSQEVRHLVVSVVVLLAQGGEPMMIWQQRTSSVEPLKAQSAHVDIVLAKTMCI